MKREHLAIAGSPPSGADRWRVELLSGPPNGKCWRLPLARIADPSVGAYARLYAGRIAFGSSKIPVAVKVQRENVRSGEGEVSADAKFQVETRIHRRIQRGLDSDQLRRAPVVQNFEPPDGDDLLPPSIVCMNAKWAIAPRCPRCKLPLVSPPLSGGGGPGPALVCEDAQCGEPHREAYDLSDPAASLLVLEGSVRHDPACDGCSFQSAEDTAPCSVRVRLLNPRVTSVLLFERLDVDLHDFIGWRNPVSRSVPGEAAELGPVVDLEVGVVGELLAQGNVFARGILDEEIEVPALEASLEFDEAARRVGQYWDGLDRDTSLQRVRRLAEIFDGIVQGVEHLRQFGIAHRDIKPRNICIIFEENDPRVKLIDLGLADDADIPALLRQAQVHVRHTSEFAAPECHRKRTYWKSVESRLVSGRIELRLNADAAAAAGVEAGDLVTIPQAPFSGVTYRVHPSIERGPDVWVVRLVNASVGPDFRADGPCAVPEGLCPSTLSPAIWPHRGFGADLFSAGMVLLALLTGDPDQWRYRGWLHALSALIEATSVPIARPIGSMFATWVALQSRNRPELAGFVDFEREVRGNDLAGFFRAELLGMAMRMTVRSRGGQTYLRHPGDDAVTAFQRLRADLDWILEGLRLACDLERGQTVETRLRVTRDRSSDWFRAITQRAMVTFDASEAMVTGLALLGPMAEPMGRRPFGLADLADLADLQADPEAVVGLLARLAQRVSDGDYNALCNTDRRTPSAPKPSLWTRLTGPLAVAATVALSLLIIGWAVPLIIGWAVVPSIRFWCLFLGVVILLTTLGMAATVWVISQPAAAPAPGAERPELLATAPAAIPQEPRCGPRVGDAGEPAQRNARADRALLSRPQKVL